jgi:hypothetical protein
MTYTPKVGPVGKILEGSVAVVTVVSGGRRSGKTEALARWAVQTAKMAKPGYGVVLWIWSLKAARVCAWPAVVRAAKLAEGKPKIRKSTLSVRWRDGRYVTILPYGKVVAVGHDEAALSGVRHVFVGTPRNFWAPMWRCAAVSSEAVLPAEEVARWKSSLPPDLCATEVQGLFHGIAPEIVQPKTAEMKIAPEVAPAPRKAWRWFGWFRK